MDSLLKAEVSTYLESKSELIAESFDDVRQDYIDMLMPLWNTHLGANNAVEEWHSGNVGNRRLTLLSEYVTIHLAMLVPEYLRSERVASLVPEEIKDQVPNIYHKFLLSNSTGIPFPLLMPIDLEEDGTVNDIHELISESPIDSKKAVLTEWGSPVLLALMEEGVKLPDELDELIRLPDSFT